LDLFEIARLDFEPPDPLRFPCLRLAFEAVAAGGTAPAVLNAANEVAVARFLNGEMKFTAIAEVVERTLAAYPHAAVNDMVELLNCDARARALAEQQALSVVS
jgi:1-deoxy-D-xylulose-5-phosphate reductoisomerase